MEPVVRLLTDKRASLRLTTDLLFDVSAPLPSLATEWTPERTCERTIASRCSPSGYGSHRRPATTAPTARVARVDGFGASVDRQPILLASLAPSKKNRFGAACKAPMRSSCCARRGAAARCVRSPTSIPCCAVGFIRSESPAPALWLVGLRCSQPTAVSGGLVCACAEAVRREVRGAAT